eukprot:g16823.t1
MLHTDPAKRIKISEIREHIWYTKFYDGPADPPAAEVTLATPKEIDFRVP